MKDKYKKVIKIKSKLGKKRRILKTRMDKLFPH